MRITWPTPEPASDEWPTPEPASDEWPNPTPASPEPVGVLDQDAGTPGTLSCGCDAAMVIVTGEHCRGHHEG